MHVDKSLLFVHTNTHTYTIYMWYIRDYLQYFQTCCLGDHALFGSVARETTNFKKKPFAEISFKIHLLGLKQGESAAEAGLD